MLKNLVLAAVSCITALAPVTAQCEIVTSNAPSVVGNGSVAVDGANITLDSMTGLVGADR